MTSPAQWTWVWVNSRSWWWTGRPSVLWFMGSQRVGHDWVTKLNWTETFFVNALLWIGMKTDLFSSCGHCRVFQICWHIECSALTASSFRIWNSLAGLPSPPVALFILMLPKAHLTLHTRMSGSRWVITPLWLSRSLRSFLYSSFVYTCYLFLISSASVRLVPFLPFPMPIFVWNVPLVSLSFLKRSLVFPSLLFSSISLHCSLRSFFFPPPCYSLELFIQTGKSFLFSFAFQFSSFLICL